MRIKKIHAIIICGLVLLSLILVILSEKAMAPDSSTFAWKIPWMEEPGRLQSLGSLESDMTERLHFHALEKEMATHSSVFAWRIPGTGKPDGLPSMGSHRVRHNWSDLAAANVILEKLYNCLNILLWNIFTQRQNFLFGRSQSNFLNF